MSGPAVLEDSIRSLTALITQMTAAEASALYQPERGQEGLVRRASYGTVPLLERLPYQDLDRWLDAHKLAALPLYEGGLLTALLVVKFKEHADTNKKVMTDLLPLLRPLLQLVNLRNGQLRMAARISDLELGLASEKISERVLGLLSGQPQLDREAIELLEKHVAKVLDASQFTQSLQEQLRDLELNAAQRDQTVRAKRLLQQRLGLTEQEAYQRLRTLSRQSRRKIADIAAEITGAHSDESPTDFPGVAESTECR